jgi:two-component system response regulator
LLVENNAKDRDLFLEAYRETGLVHDLVVARDGEEALKLLLPSPDASAALLRPAVVVLDLNLPTLSGYGVLRRLKSFPATRPIPVVVFTSSQDRKHPLRAAVRQLSSARGLPSIPKAGVRAGGFGACR